MKRKRQITVHDVVKELWGGREYLMPLEFCDFDIPIREKLWILLREEIIPSPQLRMLVCWWAEEALRIVHEVTGVAPDPRSIQAIAVARRYAAGEATEQELRAARNAAWYVWATMTTSPTREDIREDIRESAWAVWVALATRGTAWAPWVAWAARKVTRNSRAAGEAQLEGVRVMLRWLDEKDSAQAGAGGLNHG